MRVKLSVTVVFEIETTAHDIDAVDPDEVADIIQGRLDDGVSELADLPITGTEAFMVAAADDGAER